MKKTNKKDETMTGPAGDFIRAMLDNEPKAEIMIQSFAKTFKKEFKDRLSDSEMRELYNMILFLSCSIIDLKNKQSQDVTSIN